MNDLGERLRRAGGMVSPPGEGDPFQRLARRRDRRRRNERLGAAVLGMVLVLGVLGGTLVALSSVGGGTKPASGGSSNRGSTNHGPTLKQSTGSTIALGDGQYLYVRWTDVMPNLSFVQQTWWAIDDSGRTQFDCSTPDCMDPSCTGQDGCSGYSGPPNKTYGPGTFPTDDDMSGLSTDPAELLPQLLERTAPGGKSPEPAFSPGPELTPGVTAGGLLDAIENILADPNGAPELKAAVFQVASGVQGVTVRTNAVDPVGRPATVLEIPLADGGTINYYFDPATHLLMATGSSDNQGSYSVYDQGIVDSTNATPTGGQWLFPESPQPSPTPSS